MAMVNTGYWLPTGRHMTQASQLGPKVSSHFASWTEWTIAMALRWWQHCPGYIINIT